MITIEFSNQDGTDGFKSYLDLDKAKAEALSLSENGCHCISVFDVDGVDVSF